MTKPYSLDLRERVTERVAAGDSRESAPRFRGQGPAACLSYVAPACRAPTVLGAPRAARACCLETARAAGSATSPNSFRRCYGSCYKSFAFARTRRRLKIKHIRTKPLHAQNQRQSRTLLSKRRCANGLTQELIKSRGAAPLAPPRICQPKN
jgi:hypothetical protein